MRNQDKRTIILNAAMKLLAEQGFHGAPMAKIAESANVGAGTIYRYFENRDVLILEVHTMIYKELHDFLMDNYPTDRPIRERFFHICRKMFKFHLSRPLHFMYSEQFHNSPYGLEFRKEKVLNKEGDFAFTHELFAEGRDNQVIKDLPVAVFFTLGFAPVFWALRDHHSGLITLDDDLMELIISSSWDSIKM